MTAITIHLDVSLADLKKAAATYYGNSKATKKDVALFIAALIEADVMDILHKSDESE